MSNSSKVTVWESSACILQALVEELAKLSREDLAESIVVLPTSRLATYCLAGLAQKKKSFIPPQMFTLEALLQQHKPQNIEHQPASELFIDLLLSYLLKERKFHHLFPGRENEIKQFFYDIEEYGMEDIAFERLEATLRQNFFHSEVALQNLLQRFLELKALYVHFTQLLGEQNLMTSNRLERHIVGQWIKELSPLQEMPGKWFYFVGFTTVKEYIKPLLQSFSGKENCKIWLSEGVELMGEVNPLEDLQKLFTPFYSVEKKISLNESSTFSYREITSCPSLLHEVIHCVESVKNLIDQGTAPSKIAILLTSEPSYGKPLKLVCKHFGVDINSAIPLPLAQSAFGSWISALLSLCKEEEDIQSILTWLTHPLTLALFGKTYPDIPISLELITYSVCKSGVVQGFKKLSAGIEHEELRVYLQYQETYLQKFLDWKEDNPVLPVGTWSMHLVEFLQPMLELIKVWQDEGITAPLERVLAELAQFQNFASVHLSATDFFALLQDKVLQQEIRSVGFPLKGVQVITFSESRYIPFEAVFILGAIEGFFPRALPKDHLVDDWLKVKIGLPGWKYIEALEETTFQLLFCRIQHLAFSYPEMLEKVSTIRARFIEKIRADKIATIRRVDPSKSFLQVLEAGEKQELQEAILKLKEQSVGKFLGNRLPFFSHASSYLLEDLFQCPYKFLLKSLKVEVLELPKEDDPKQEGKWLHQILEIFFQGDPDKEVQKLSLKLPETRAHSLLLERINTITQKYLPRSFLHTSLGFHLQHYAWPKFVEHVCKFFIKDGQGNLVWEQTQSWLKEYKMGVVESPVKCEIPLPSGVAEALATVQFRGILDSVDPGEGGIFLLTDYKRKYISQQRVSHWGLSPQLSLYALALHHLMEEQSDFPLDKGVYGFWNIFEGQWYPRAVGEVARNWALEKNLVNKKTPDIRQSVHHLYHLWEWRLKSLLKAGEDFIVDPDTGCKMCAFSNTCRKEDPSMRNRILAHSKLSLWQKEREAHV